MRAPEPDAAHAKAEKSGETRGRDRCGAKYKSHKVIRKGKGDDMLRSVLYGYIGFHNAGNEIEQRVGRLSSPVQQLSFAKPHERGRQREFRTLPSCREITRSDALHTSHGHAATLAMRRTRPDPFIPGTSNAFQTTVFVAMPRRSGRHIRAFRSNCFMAPAKPGASPTP